MSLTSALQVGRSALAASTIGIQVAGNNTANASTPGYSRQIANLVPAGDLRYGRVFLGRGVEVQDIRRQVDAALQARLNRAVSDDASASLDLELLTGVETTVNALSDSDLSSELSRFFNAWSELGNTPGSSGARTLVVQRGKAAAGAIRAQRQGLLEQRAQVDGRLGSMVARADEILSSIASINSSIVNAEAGNGNANAMRDQRDALVTELGTLIDARTIEQPNGVLDVLVGSTPVVLAGQSRGLELRTRTVDGVAEPVVSVRSTREPLGVTSGQVGSLLASRENLVSDTIARLDRLAAQLVFRVNRVHGQSYGSTRATTASSTLAIAAGDRDRAFNDPANASLAALPFAPKSGSFLVHVRNSATGAVQTTRVNIDLDGLRTDGSAGTADDSSLATLTTDLAAIPNLTASVGADGRLTLDASRGFDLTFSEDTSDVLATLGINAFFTGASAGDIGVRDELASNPTLLGAGRLAGGAPNENAAALGVAALRDESLDALGGLSLGASWGDAVQSIAVRLDAAKTRSEATGVVRGNLEAQRAAVSGVSMDEEAISLIAFQQQYQGAARLISVVDELTKSIINLV
ncbi:MAG: flagellar hook-associated protein FlgK [Phycisphaerae bacterium]|nr:flagellar hook-associated protein FlgK [Phycisphaerae bacterium]